LTTILYALHSRPFEWHVSDNSINKLNRFVNNQMWQSFCIWSW